MANFRRSNQRNNRKAGSWLGRLIVFTIALIIGIIYLSFKANDWLGQNNSSDKVEIDNGQRFYLPESKGEIVHHKHYSLSYNEKHEQANWVAYILTESSLRLPNVKRAKRFNPDYSVNSQSSFHSDYTHSGYTRGHLAPAGDMAFSEASMKESFLMSNMSPQIRKFNNGIWKELEETVREWAYDFDELYIVSGPILNSSLKEKIGKNKVTVPEYFYKIILDIKGKDQKAISFLIPHERSEKHLKEYAVSIDELEALTGFDFFPDLLDDSEEEKIESEFDVSAWDFDEKKFKNRINKWNHQ